jgi:hypothetical protein
MTPDSEKEIIKYVNERNRADRATLIEMGRKLSQLTFTRKQMPIGLKIGYTQARKIILISQDERITAPKYQDILPETMSALDEITKLSDRLFLRAVKLGIINPEGNALEIKAFRQRQQGISEPDETELPMCFKATPDFDPLLLDEVIATMKEFGLKHVTTRQARSLLCPKRV